jgi:HlyD family secretion protein
MRYFLTTVTIIGLALLGSCSSNRSEPGGSGLIEATQTIISAQTAGELRTLYFDEGNDIHDGDTIGIIDTTTVMLQIRQAQAARQASLTKQEMARIQIRQADDNLDLATKEFDRVAKLLPAGSANQQQYDQVENKLKQAKLLAQSARAALDAAEAEYNQIEAQLALLQKQFSDCFPTAPVTGIITNKYIEVGELMVPAKPLIEIAQLDTVTVKIYLPPRDLTQIKLGDTATVDPEDGRTKPLIGRVSWISSEAEFTPKNVQTKEARADLVYAVKITIPNPDQALKVGMPVSVKI